MNLTCEDLDPIDDVTTEQLGEILSTDVFGKFAVLSQSDSEFIQAACDWQPTSECSDFLKANESDPWILEYHEDDTHYRVQSYVALHLVIRAFKAYLSGNPTWRTDFVWNPITI